MLNWAQFEIPELRFQSFLILLSPVPILIFQTCRYGIVHNQGNNPPSPQLLKT